MNNTVLSCHQLEKTYLDGMSKIEVLKNVALSVQKGEMIAIVGASGSGKSTLLHLLGGLDQPSSGEVKIKGQSLHALSEVEKCALRNQHLGFIYQFHHLLPEFTALENVSMPLLIRGEKSELFIEKSKAMLEQVGLGKRMGHYLSQLSGGERQRVAIARALIANPLCVLADEPTGNLDPKNSELVLGLFFALQKTYQTSVIIVTHDERIAERADRIFSIEDGHLVGN